MEIREIAGFAVITADPKASAELYRTRLGLPLEQQGDYLFAHGFPGAHHFGVWPLQAAAQSCFGRDEWPPELAVPTASVEFELADVEAVSAAAAELEQQGQRLIHGARTEPWGQTVARFLSPEAVLIGLSYAPWLHGQEG